MANLKYDPDYKMPEWLKGEYRNQFARIETKIPGQATLDEWIASATGQENG